MLYKSLVCLVVMGCVDRVVMAQADYERSAAGPASQRSSDSLPGLARDYARADAQLGSAQARLDDAERNMTLTIARLQQAYETSPQTIGARRAADDAWKRYQAARDTALRDLGTNEEYRRLEAQRNHLDDLLNRGSLSPRLRWEVATLKLEVSDAMTGMETGILSASEPVKSARRDLVAAQEKVDAQRNAFRQSMPNDPVYTRAKADLENARVALQTANVQYQAAAAAYNQALSDQAAYYDVLQYRYRNTWYPWYWGSNWFVAFPRGMR